MVSLYTQASGTELSYESDDSRLGILVMHWYKKLSLPDKGNLAKRITSDKIREALYASEKESSWRNKWHYVQILETLWWNVNKGRKGERRCTSLPCSADADRYIQQHSGKWGDTNIAFCEGWMCPICKKKDSREIGNYRQTHHHIKYRL